VLVFTKTDTEAAGRTVNVEDTDPKGRPPSVIATEDDEKKPAFVTTALNVEFV